MEFVPGRPGLRLPPAPKCGAGTEAGKSRGASREGVRRGSLAIPGEAGTDVVGDRAALAAHLWSIWLRLGGPGGPRQPFHWPAVPSALSPLAPRGTRTLLLEVRVEGSLGVHVCGGFVLFSHAAATYFGFYSYMELRRRSPGR